MEIGNNKYVFVIHKAKLNGKGRVVFKVSTKEIKLSSGTSKKLLKLPRGHHDGVRFDIDYSPYDPYDPYGPPVLHPNTLSIQVVNGGCSNNNSCNISVLIIFNDGAIVSFFIIINSSNPINFDFTNITNVNILGTNITVNFQNQSLNILPKPYINAFPPFNPPTSYSSSASFTCTESTVVTTALNNSPYQNQILNQLNSVYHINGKYETSNV
jgi:hypothetical protein